MTNKELGADERVISCVRAFEALFRQYHSTILALAYNRLSHARDAEDAAAEVFSAAWRLRHDSGSVFTPAWLYGALRNVVGNEYRRRDRSAARLEKAAGAAVDCVPDVAADDDARDLQRAILTLGLDDRELIWMVYWEDLTSDEIAAILDCSDAALRVRLHRAKRRLKTALEANHSPRSEGRRPRTTKTPSIESALRARP